MDHTARLEAAWEAQEAHGMEPHRTDLELLTTDEIRERASFEWARFHRAAWIEVTG